MALAEPRFGRPTDEVTVIFVIDRSLSVPVDVDLDKPVTEQEDRRWTRIREFVENAVKTKGAKHLNDQAGVILFGKRPKLALPPSTASGWRLDPQMAGPIDGQYTDIAAAIKLAMASFPGGLGPANRAHQRRQREPRQRRRAGRPRQAERRADRRHRHRAGLPQRERSAGAIGRGAAADDGGHESACASAGPQRQPESARRWLPRTDPRRTRFDGHGQDRFPADRHGQSRRARQRRRQTPTDGAVATGFERVPLLRQGQRAEGFVLQLPFDVHADPQHG